MNKRPVMFMVPGPPVAQGRAKARAFTTSEGRTMAQVYEPKTSADWKAFVKQRAYDAMGSRMPFLGPVRVSIVCRFTPSESWEKWRKEAALDRRIGHTKKPDVDNVAKAAKDALKGIIWNDDSQVVELNASKEWHERAALWIKVTPLKAAPSNVKSQKAMEEILG